MRPRACAPPATGTGTGTAQRHTAKARLLLVPSGPQATGLCLSPARAAECGASAVSVLRSERSPGLADLALGVGVLLLSWTGPWCVVAVVRIAIGSLLGGAGGLPCELATRLVAWGLDLSQNTQAVLATMYLDCLSLESRVSGSGRACMPQNLYNCI